MTEEEIELLVIFHRLKSAVGGKRDGRPLEGAGTGTLRQCENTDADKKELN